MAVNASLADGDLREIGAQAGFDLVEMDFPAVGAIGLMDEAFDLQEAEYVGGPG